MERFFYTGNLFDVYGSLLTEKQQTALRLHLYEDFSLSEIGEELGISRQAAYDTIHRAEAVLAGYEQKLGVLAHRRAGREALRQICAQLETLQTAFSVKKCNEIIKAVQKLIGEEA